MSVKRSVTRKKKLCGNSNFWTSLCILFRMNRVFVVPKQSARFWLGNNCESCIHNFILKFTMLFVVKQSDSELKWQTEWESASNHLQDVLWSAWWCHFKFSDFSSWHFFACLLDTAYVSEISSFYSFSEPPPPLTITTTTTMMMTIKKGICSFKILWCVCSFSLTHFLLGIDVFRARREFWPKPYIYTLSAHYAQKREWRSSLFLTFYIVVGFRTHFLFAC